MHRFEANTWAVILGCSSGMGLAAAKKLARHGMNICAIHRDKRAAMPRFEEEITELRSMGVQCVSWNVNAVESAARASVLDSLAHKIGGTGRIRLLLHSIAWGSVRPIAPTALERRVAPVYEELLDEDGFGHTVQAMATSMLSWVQGLHRERLFAADACVIGLTSEGSAVAWEGYAAVGAAKAALESLCRSIAVEYGPHGLRANVIQAGVTDTPALRAIPCHGALMEAALARNPMGRLTRTSDVASAIYLLCLDEAAWINGAVLRVDGGEFISSSRGRP